MSLISSAKGGSGFDPVPEGPHLGRCVTVVDLGHLTTTWKGKEKVQHKVYIGFEIPAVRVEWEDKETKEKKEGPAIIGQRYTNNIGDKANLGKHLVSWRGRAFTEQEKEAFDLFTILDVPCQLSVVHNQSGDNTYANISGIMGLPPGVVVPDRETPLLKYSPNDPETAPLFDSLPSWMQETCKEGHESLRQEGLVSKAPPPTTNDFDDDIPF